MWVDPPARAGNPDRYERYIKRSIRPETREAGEIISAEEKRGAAGGNLCMCRGDPPLLLDISTFGFSILSDLILVFDVSC